MSTAAIDLSRLPAPNVVEPLDYETILAERKAYLLSLWPEAERPALAARLALESEPLNKLLQENAYRELILRQRINDGARAVLAPFSSGTDLDNLLALLQAERLEGESDSDFRNRALLSVFAYSTAGPTEAYRYHARSAHPEVLDVAVDRPSPGQVRVTILSRADNGAPSELVLRAVEQALNADDIRPLNDEVQVEAGGVEVYKVRARLYVPPGAAPEPILQAAQAAAEQYVAAQHRLGAAVRLSGIYAALHQPGVLRVELLEPVADIEPLARVAPRCTAIELSMESQYV